MMAIDELMASTYMDLKTAIFDHVFQFKGRNLQLYLRSSFRVTEILISERKLDCCDHCSCIEGHKMCSTSRKANNGSNLACQLK